jgi:hypothetical protein
MANEEQLSILKQGVNVWNKWREENQHASIDLYGADLMHSNCSKANLSGTNLTGSYLTGANLTDANLYKASLDDAAFDNAILTGADLSAAHLWGVDLSRADLVSAKLLGADLRRAIINQCNFSKAKVAFTVLGNLDLSQCIGLEDVNHYGPSNISTDTFALSKGKIPEVFLRGCGLSDWEIEETKLYNPDLSNNEIDKILYRIHDLRANQALQISSLFVSYSHGDSTFVDKLESQLNTKSIRFWRDIHDMKAGRIETQIDQAINQNRTVLLILSQNSIKSDWVEHEVRTARELEKGAGRDVLCPIALDDSWKSSHWPKRIMEQIMEYNILDFSAWEDDVKFEGMFRKLIDGLELFYKDKSHGK